ncbi:MAG: hypothetical protein SLAVMIC_00514 [uncultured marine phage]|uniref:Uncharacterized protein n=1 Tax=uncultured marine phage TaxID=707152 RepID=A0A8D9C922_9VIRU|nr:MAG: hypothetical protein SLAVMIC_00514 [uncultured marine phage]
MISPVYHNLNKIDSVLKQEFGSDNVTLEHVEKRNSNGTSFDFKFIIESENHTVKMMIGGEEALVMENSISWAYFEDPTNESSKLIRRNNFLDSLSISVRQIFNNKMFAKPYLESVATEMINENVDAEPILERPLFVKEEKYIQVSEKALSELLDNYGMLIDDIDKVGSDQLNVNLSSKEFSGSINTANRVSIESSLNEFDVVDQAWFTDNRLNILFNGDPELYD